MLRKNIIIKREVIFEMPDTSEYSVVCTFGYNSSVNFAQWLHVQKKTYYKKFLFFGDTMWKCYEVNRYWLCKKIETADALKNTAIQFYDETILLTPRLIKKNNGTMKM